MLSLAMSDVCLLLIVVHCHWGREREGCYPAKGPAGKRIFTSVDIHGGRCDVTVYSGCHGVASSVHSETTISYISFKATFCPMCIDTKDVLR